ncbi:OXIDOREDUCTASE 2OG-FE II OXYGENASE FAMILY PROTEIN [Salix purpurea]|uniref:OXIDOREDUCTASE 2OG-FE II OXYGENASE FAMILY PROTEIN n=1 Tax=Salix purpurea TaxID=77065 RepID=A0A9Q0YXF8_SALPP|nr:OXIDOREDUCTASE 2OG-FE II OXYGENASE FAMILY PROTEIN [Salix purpurea]
MAPTLAVSFNDSSEINDFVLKKGNGVKGLSETGLDSLPEQYIQPLEERMCDTKTMSQESVPLIDISKWDDPEVAEAICEAAEKWGFFQIINHGVPIEVLENVKEATHLFFGLSAEEKRKYLKEFSPSKNVRFGTSFSPEAEKALEWKDYLSLFYVSEDEASALWPSVCRDQVLEYMKRSEIVVRKLLDVLMKNLNVTEIDETKESLLMGSKRINRAMVDTRALSTVLLLMEAITGFQFPFSSTPGRQRKSLLSLKYWPVARRPCIRKFCTRITSSISSKKHMMGRQQSISQRYDSLFTFPFLSGV